MSAQQAVRLRYADFLLAEIRKAMPDVPTDLLDRIERVLYAEPATNTDPLQRMADPTEYRKVYAATTGTHPCQVEGCRISQEEHHRLMYGVLAENRELRARRTTDTAPT